MTTTTQPTETLKAVRSKSSWEKLGIEFKQTETIGMSLTGRTGEPHLTWNALYRGQYVIGGGKLIGPFIEWMNKKEDRVMAIIKSIK